MGLWTMPLGSRTLNSHKMQHVNFGGSNIRLKGENVTE